MGGLSPYRFISNVADSAVEQSSFPQCRRNIARVLEDELWEGLVGVVRQGRHALPVDGGVVDVRQPPAPCPPMQAGQAA